MWTAGKMFQCGNRPQKLKNHPSFANHYNNLGMVLNENEKLKEAESCFKESLRVGSQNFPPDYPRRIPWLCNYSAVLKKMGQTREAEACLFEALEICNKKLPEWHADRLLPLSGLVILKITQNKHSEAEGLLEDCLRTLFSFEKKNGFKHAEEEDWIRVYTNLMHSRRIDYISINVRIRNLKTETK